MRHKDVPRTCEGRRLAWRIRLTSSTFPPLLRCGLCRIGSTLELGRCDLAIAIPVIAGEQWIGLADKFCAAQPAVSIVVEVGKLSLLENRSCLLDGPEFCGIDIAIAIAIGQVEDSGRVLRHSSHV